MERIPVLIINDNKEIIFFVEMSLDPSKYIIKTAETVTDGIELIQLQNVPYILIADYQIGTHLGTALIQRALEKQQNVLGIILMFGDINFRSNTLTYKKALLEKNIPYFEMTKPFNLIDLEYILNNIHLQNSTSLNFTYLYTAQLSKTLRQARETLGLDRTAIIQALLKQGIDYSDQYYRLIETNERFARKISATEWFVICQILHMTHDIYIKGYCKQLHIKRVMSAMLADTYLFPITHQLQQNITELSTIKEREAPLLFKISNI